MIDYCDDEGGFIYGSDTVELLPIPSENRISDDVNVWRYFYIVYSLGDCLDVNGEFVLARSFNSAKRMVENSLPGSKVCCGRDVSLRETRCF